MKDRKKEKEMARRKADYELKKKADRNFREMKKQVERMEEIEKEYLLKAQQALNSGDKMAYSISRNFLRKTIVRKRVLTAMIMTFESQQEMTKMNDIVSTFVSCMDAMTTSTKSKSSMADVAKLKKKLSEASMVSEAQAEALATVLEEMDEKSDGWETIMGGALKDDDLDKIIATGAVSDITAKPIDQDVDPLEAVRKILEGDGNKD